MLWKIQKFYWLIPETKWHSCLHNRALCSYLATLRLLCQRENNPQFLGTYHICFSWKKNASGWIEDFIQQKSIMSCKLYLNRLCCITLPCICAKYQYKSTFLCELWWHAWIFCTGPYLIVITEKSKVGEISGHTVWKVEGTEVLSYKRTMLHLTEQQVGCLSVCLSVCPLSVEGTEVLSYKRTMLHLTEQQVNYWNYIQVYWVCVHIIPSQWKIQV